MGVYRYTSRWTSFLVSCLCVNIFHLWFQVSKLKYNTSKPKFKSHPWRSTRGLSLASSCIALTNCFFFSIFWVFYMCPPPPWYLSNQCIGAHSTDRGVEVRMLSGETLLQTKTSLVIGGTRTQVLAHSMTIAANAFSIKKRFFYTERFFNWIHKLPLCHRDLSLSHERFIII